MAASDFSEASTQCNNALAALQVKLSSEYDVVKPNELEDLANGYTSAKPPVTSNSAAASGFKTVSVKKCGATVLRYFGKNRRTVEVTSSYTAYKHVLVSEGTGNYTVSESGYIREETTNTHFEKQENGTKDISASTQLIFYNKNTLNRLMPSMVFFAAHSNDFFAVKSVKSSKTLSSGWFTFFKILLLLTFLGFASFCGYHIYNTVLYLKNEIDCIVELAFKGTTVIYTALLAVNLLLTIITSHIYYNKIETAIHSNEGKQYCYWAKHIIVIFVMQCFAFGWAIFAGEFGLCGFLQNINDVIVTMINILTLLLFPALAVISIYTLVFGIYISAEWRELSAKRIEKLKTKYTEEEFNYLNTLYDDLCKKNIYVDPSKIERELAPLLSHNMKSYVH